ncbi:MAG TPA: alanine racemase [Anaeromyxobacteraceae bacterium]|nr:alanine racemase [Anaeromyxobacteraceae bacterium]
MPIRPTEALVDLAALANNYRVAVEVGGRPAIGVVKADAYGHGAVEAARELVGQGCPLLAVALVEEGLELREAGIAAPILVVGGAYGERFDLLVRHRLTPVVFQAAHLRGLAEAARAAGVRAAAHLKIDTGMGRVGIPPEDLLAFLDLARRTPEVALEGLCTHFASADLEDRALTERQVALFDEVAEAMARAGMPLRYRHLANSAGTVEYPAARQDLTRPGILLYGYLPMLPHASRSALARQVAGRLRRVLTWRTAVVHLKWVPAGTPISYGGRWVAERPSRIATLPLGYADGYPRQLSGRPGFGRAEVLVRGRRAPVAGTVCMDMTMVDVTDVPGVENGDEVVLLGAQGDEAVDADELAERAGTIAYEILCGVGRRVPRRFVRG